MKAPPAPTERPNLETARRVGWRTWIFQEWGLLILAAVLAVIIWEITSTNVIRELDIQGVRVELYVAEQDRDRVGAVLDRDDTRVTLQMTCSERERRAVHEALTAVGGGTPVLRLRIHPEVAETVRPIGENYGDVWQWPVNNAEEIELSATMPSGRVYRIEGLQQVHIAPPPTKPSAEQLRGLGYQLQTLDPDTPAAAKIKVAPGFMEFRAPKAILGASDGPFTMIPDEIDVRSLFEGETPQLGVIQTFELSFTDWRAAKHFATNDSDEKGRVAQFRAGLPVVRATARFALQRIETKPIQNRIEVLLNPAYAWEFDGVSPDRLIREEIPWQFSGELVGPADALKEIAERKGDWHWAIWVEEPKDGWPKTDSMMDTADNVRKGVRAKIVWVSSDPTWVRRGVYFDPDQGKNEDGFFL